MKTTQQLPSTREDLIELVKKGSRLKYLYFWGHRKSPDNRITQSCFSQWYHSPFTIDNISYPTAEHYMMAEKARLFKDSDTEARILAAKSPAEAKKLGRLVQNYNDEQWSNQRFHSVVQGNIAKFGQNPELAAFLKGTNKRVLVEASPVDPVWGVGLAADDSKIDNPRYWKGLNLLGFALMEVRENLNK